MAVHLIAQQTVAKEAPDIQSAKATERTRPQGHASRSSLQPLCVHVKDKYQQSLKTWIA
jgi:hypothetical protein